MTETTQAVKKRGRGRPRTHKRVSIVELQKTVMDRLRKFREFEFETRVLECIYKTLAYQSSPRWEIADLHDKFTGWAGRVDPGKHSLGEGLRLQTTGEWYSGKALLIDLKHHFPRIRVELESGKLMDIPLKCPQCRRQTNLGGKQRRRRYYDYSERKGWLVTDGGAIFCPNGCITWLTEDVRRVLRKNSLID